MSLLLDKIFASLALGHLTVDLLNGQRAVLLAFWSVPLALSNTMIGVISTIYVTSAALAQPIFGWLADRWGPRWITGGGIIWMAVWFTGAILVPGKTALVFLVFASLGSGAFHPSGSVRAANRGMEILEGREITSTSVFFLFGQSGSFFGPILGGPLLDNFGVIGLLPLVLFAFPIGAFALNQLKHDQKPMHSQSQDSTGRIKFTGTIPVLVSLIFVSGFQNWAQANMVTFVPKFLSDIGETPSVYGIVSSFFMGGYAIGNLVGGYVGDRIGKQPIMLISLLGSSLPLYLFAASGFGTWSYVLIPISGLLLGAAFSVTVVFSQNLFPGGKALASGLVLGFMFSSGSVGTLLTGYIADHFGFSTMFMVNAAIAAIGGLAAIGLKDKVLIQPR